MTPTLQRFEVSLPTLSDAGESRAARRVAFVAACGLAVLFFIWTHAYWTPFHPGVDQNGYLVGGKMFSRTLLPRQRPTVPGHADQFDPHAFVANMWVTAGNDPHAFDPKYPIGLPLLYAISIWITGGGFDLAYWLSPLAMAASLPAVYAVAQRYGGIFGGLLATIGFAISPLTGLLVNNPNSHAVAIFCCTWGMAGALRWWHDGGRGWAIVGGLLVGYTTTVRYTEGLLVLPLLWMAIVRPRSSPPPLEGGGGGRGDRVELGKSAAEPLPLPPPSRGGGKFGRLLDSLCLLAAWATPVLALAAYNWFVLGALTGYDATNESTGFAWSYFFDNWETLLRNMGDAGLFFILPLSIVSLIAMAWRSWRTAAVLWLWAGPCLMLYAFYYWGPDGISYLRFFATVLPPLLAAAFWPLRAFAMPQLIVRPWRRNVRVALAVAAAAIVSGGVFLAVRYDAEAHRLIPLAEYLDQPATAFQRTGAAAAFFGGIAMAGLVTAAVVMTTRRDVIALALGVVTLLAAAGSADLSTAQGEQNAYDMNVQLAEADAVRQAVPDGAMVVCREENLLQYLQFVTDDRCYTGFTFDHNWIAGRPRAFSDDPVLIDPVRGKQLFDLLGKFDQNQLNDQARAALRAALTAKRRIFVVETVAADQMLKAVREKKEGPVPDFVRRYVPKDKNPQLVARRTAWWTIPQVVKDEVKPNTRGRRNYRPGYRMTCYQIWEITGA